MLPVALLAGLVPGIAVAIAVGDWRPAVVIPLGLAALAGTITAAVEDGRVQRDVDATRDGPSTAAGLAAAREMALAGDDEGARAAVERALRRGATPEGIARRVDHPDWPRERILRMEREIGTMPPRPGTDERR